MATAILDGDAVTGVTVMQVVAEMDAGPIVAQLETAIEPEETSEDLTTRLFREGAALLTDVLPRWARREVQARPQDDRAVTVTSRLQRADGQVDWTLPAVEIARRVRAFHPWPGSSTRWRGRGLKIVSASPWEGSDPAPVPPAEVTLLPGGAVGVGTGRGLLRIRNVQVEGRRAVDAQDFVQGHRDFIGSRLGS